MENQPYLEFDGDDIKLDFKHHLEFKSSEEMNIMFADDNQPLSNLIVDIAIRKPRYYYKRNPSSFYCDIRR